MIKYFFYKLVILCGFIALTSCDIFENKNNIESIIIDFTSFDEIDIRDSSKVKIVELEATDASLLSEIKDVEYLKDKILVYSADMVVAFDLKGKFLYDIDRRGNGPGEYVRTTSFYIRKDTIFLYDDVSKQMLAYDENGNFLKSIRTEEEIAFVYPLENQGFVAKNKYRGNNNHTPSICLLDNQLKKIKDIENRYLSSGNSGFDNFYPFKDEILYWEFLNDTIFSIIQQNRVEPKYFVDFQEYQIPRSITSTGDENKILEYITNSDNPKIATSIKYIQEDDQYLRFIFVQKEAILNYTIYDKQSKQSKIFRIIDSQDELRPLLFMKYKDGNIIMSAINLNGFDDNPLLLFINDR